MTESPCDESEFCQELRGEGEPTLFSTLYAGLPPTRILTTTENLAVLVDVAPLVEGHLLVVPKEHLLSIGHLPEKQWQEFRELVDLAVDVLQERYGSVAVFEHGSSISGRQAVSCVEHAHWHLVPVQGDPTPALVAESIRLDPVVETMEALKLLAQTDQSYLYVEIPSLCVTAVAGSLPPAAPQLVRRILARHMGIEAPHWDFAVHQDKELLRRTVSALRDRFPPAGAQHTADGIIRNS